MDLARTLSDGNALPPDPYPLHNKITGEDGAFLV